MKRTVFLLIMAFVAIDINAQYTLNVENVTNDIEIFPSEGSEALLVIRCHKDIPLTSFYTQMDLYIEPDTTELEGTDSIYNFVLPTGKIYPDRTMRVTADGYFTTEIRLGYLEPKKVYTFQLTDPDAMVDAGCYREHRNKGMDELRNTRYTEAREQFVVARDCSDVNKEENELNIANVDSILSYQRQALIATELLDYLSAADRYNEIIRLNPYDRMAEEKRKDCLEKYRSECEILFKQAEFYYNDKEYKKAEELFQKILQNGCPESAMANDRILKMANLNKYKNEHARVFTYEYIKDMPIGFHFGKYKLKKAGGFFNLNLSGNIFKFAKGDLHYNATYSEKYPKQDYPEVNMNFGWTIKIANPVWIYFGPGASAKFYYGQFGEITDNGVEKPEIFPKDTKAPDNYDGFSANKDYESRKVNAAIAVSPTIGVTVKYSWFAIRIGYEYRYAIKQRLRNFIGEHRLTLGAGIAW